MPFQQPIIFLFNQLREILKNLTDQQYCSPSVVLSNATIGQHLRHTIEFYQELYKGYETGSVNYDKRQRDYRIETERYFALQKIDDIINNMCKPDKSLLLVASLSVGYNQQFEFQTNYNRELLYNLEHTVHHMALIRIGIEEISSMQLPSNFGVAASTILSGKLCAQ